jgi:hypothetical protein
MERQGSIRNAAQKSANGEIVAAPVLVPAASGGALPPPPPPPPEEEEDDVPHRRSNGDNKINLMDNPEYACHETLLLPPAPDVSSVQWPLRYNLKETEMENKNTTINITTLRAKLKIGKVRHGRHGSNAHGD